MLLAAAVLAALAIGMAGCGGGGDDDDDEGGAADAKKVTQAKASGDVTWCIGKDTTGAFGTVVDNFHKANPDANAKLLELPEAADLQREQQIQRLQAESDECDVLGVDVIWTAEYAGQGWLQDITTAVEKRKSEFIPSTVETASTRTSTGPCVQHERGLPLLPQRPGAGAAAGLGGGLRAGPAGQRRGLPGLPL